MIHTDCTRCANSLARFHSSPSLLVPSVLLVLSVWRGSKEEEGREGGKEEVKVINGRSLRREKVKGERFPDSGLWDGLWTGVWTDFPKFGLSFDELSECSDFVSLDYSNLIVRALQATCDDVANTSKT